LDDPEFYIRTASKKAADKVLNDLVSSIAKEFADAKL